MPNKFFFNYHFNSVLNDRCIPFSLNVKRLFTCSKISERGQKNIKQDSMMNVFDKTI